MNSKEIKNSVTKSTLIQIIHNELADLDLSTNYYIQLANSILDDALDKKQHNGSAARGYSGNVVKKLPAHTDDISIRPFEPSKDTALLQKWTDDKTGKEFLLSRIENTALSIDELVASDSNIFGMVCNTSGKPIGIVGFLNYNRQQQKAELRKLIGDPGKRGKGYGKKASKLWVSYGIHGLQLRKIYLYTFDTNLRNIRINEELGFKMEGIYRAENIIEGIPKDIIRMSLLV